MSNQVHVNPSSEVFSIGEFVKVPRAWLNIGINTSLLIAVLAFIFVPWRNFSSAPTPSPSKSNQTSTPTQQATEANLKTDDRLLEDAFVGTSKSEDVSDGHLKVGEVPLSKFHSSAAKELELGNRLAEKKNWGDAHSHYINCMSEMHKDQRTRVVLLDENWFSVCYGLIAVCLSEEKLFEMAVSHLNEAIKLDPAVKENYVVRGNLYRRLHKEKEAESDFRMASGKSVLKCYPAWAQKLEWCQLPR